MIRGFLSVFLLGFTCFLSEGVFTQQKIQVYDHLSIFPIHDVNIVIYGKNVVSDGQGWKKAEGVQSLAGTIAEYIQVEQHFTNKKGKVQTDIFKLADSSWRISFYHENYILNTISYDSLLSLDFVLYLKSNANTLDEMVVSATRMGEKKRDVIQKIKIISSNEIKNQNQSSMADLIGSSGNVFVQKSQLGGGSPIIRGFETNKVLMVVDGVRMNNAIYRGGHLQNVITLDNAIMDRVEVVFGPGSVMYGSDAIGGVMSFKTKDPTLSHKDKGLIIGEGYTRYFSAANGYSSNVNISVANRKFGSLSSFTYSNFGDLRQGANRTDFTEGFGERNWYASRINGVDTMLNNSDPNLQVGSGYAQFDLLQKFTFKPNEFVTHKLNLQLSNSGNVDRYDRLSQSENGIAKYAEWYYGPQFRFLSAYTLSLSKKNRLFDASELTLAYQAIEESRMVRRYQEEQLMSREEALDIFTLNFDFSKKIRKHELRYGLDLFYNLVESSAFSTDINSMQVSTLDTRYPDGGSDMSSFALYLTDNWEVNDKTILSGGLRGSHVQLNAEFVDKTFFPFPFSSIEQRNSSLNGNIGVIYMPTKSIRYTLSGATGFRAPNIDDVSKVFESIPGKVIVPNPDLKPEYSYNLELGSEIVLFRKINLATNLYSTFLSNALTIQNTTINGVDSVLYEGTYSTVVTTMNTSNAFVLGVEGVLNATIGRSIRIEGTFNYTYGRILTDSVPYPLDHIPPVFGKCSIKYQKKKIVLECFVNYSAWKRYEDYNLVGEDNYAFAIAGQGMPSWYTLNSRLNYSFSKNISIQLACENILDRNYRSFASNISAPGRNFIFTVRGRF
ncbi:MAG: TonB-dependent receptor [Crocinitomicaceae bacterium]